jgi:SMI1 / KNR4 family (SUKH-1)
MTTMSTFNWESFMRQWGQEMLDYLENMQQTHLPENIVQSRWLGHSGATQAQIISTETRLGITLPPSYRAFLQTTNGWEHITPFIYRLWSTDEIEWFAVRHQAWIDASIEKFLAHFATRKSIDNSSNGANHRSEILGISDEDYFVYGSAQNCMNLRAEYLQTALEISSKKESAIYLLNPQVISADGEWEAWFFCDWLPGADRYRSFQEMMQAEYESFLELRES